jgi:hypothetical protein
LWREPGLFNLRAQTVFPVTQTADKNGSYVSPAVPAGDGGHLLRVDLSAPGPILRVDYECQGEACGWVYECPDGGKCGGKPRLSIEGGKATWWAWSNSGAPARFTFRIHWG